ncbi:MAG: DMT family transporter [Pelagimonas sp.]|jgi:drug/metabolite transporter (DMT)-like permease|nr:DMT family transporter [Pelagimonas sp.]
MRLFLLTALTMAAFAANSVLTRAGIFESGLDAFWFGTIRLLAGAAVLALLVALKGQWAGWRNELNASALLGLFLYIFGFSLAYMRLESGLGALILFGMVQITMFAGGVIAGERPPALRWIGSGVAFAGLIYLLRPTGTGVDLQAALAMVVAGIGWGLYSLAGKHARDPLVSTAVNFVLVAPVGVLLALLIAAPTGGWPMSGVVLAIMSGAVTSGLGYALWYRILPELQRSVASVAQLTVPVIAMGGGMAFLNEPLTTQFIIASVLVLGGVALAVLRR